MLHNKYKNHTGTQQTEAGSPRDSEKRLTPLRSRAGMSRAAYCRNPEPAYQRAPDDKPRPPQIQKLAALAAKRDVTAHSMFRVLIPVTDRRRYLHPCRRDAINAIVDCAIQFLDQVTWEIRIPVMEIARLTGLSTIGPSKIESFSRCSRAIQTLERFGIIELDPEHGNLVFDKARGTFLTKFLRVTTRFFEICGISADEAIRQRELAFERIKTDPKKGSAIMSLQEYLHTSKRESIRRGFTIRNNKRHSTVEHSFAKKLAELPLDEQKRVIAARLYRRMDEKTTKHYSANPGQFESLVFAELRRLTSLRDEPPPREN